ncbi:MAG: capsular biosynthesis protein [Deltaproteobacteria bacterium]|nr:capsular biosynthesis protein [Deltaproteobacteria bacterium]
MMSTRAFLFLQGICSPFFICLADNLRSAGHSVFRINFNGGDMAYWSGRPAWAFRGKVGELPAFLDEKFCSHGITDMVLFGDRRPLHRQAIEPARKKGIRIHVFEEGYFRPFWVTLEREGVNGHSLLPRNPDWYRKVGARLPDYGNGEKFKTSFGARALHDLLYHLAGTVNPLFFPRYRTHASCNAAVEYSGYTRRFAMAPFYERSDRRVLDNLISDARPFFFLPLQLNSDAQIRDHSPFGNMNDVIEFVMESFARYAPGDARLVIKNHPLDTGLVNYPKIISRLARYFDLSGRVFYLEDSYLVALLRLARGVVTVNSTIGLWAMKYRCPTITLSNPIYNLPGLTFQGTLDEFWRRAAAPDDELFRCFRNTVIHTTQVNGGFYSREGIVMTVKNSLRLLEPIRSPLEELL